MKDLKYKIAKAMNYIPSWMIIQKKSVDGLITNKCPLVVFIDGEEWVLKDKNLESEHYERKVENGN